MTPASSASSTSQHLEKYKNARNRSPEAAAAGSSGKLKRYEGYEKDLHKILNKSSAKRTTAQRGGENSSELMAPLQPLRCAV